MKKRSMVFVYLFCIIASLFMSTTNTIYKVLRQTNAAMLNATMLATRNNGTTNVTVSQALLSLKRDCKLIKYFDNAYGYLVAISIYLGNYCQFYYCCYKQETSSSNNDS